MGLEVIARRILYQLTGNWLRVNCGILWGTAWTIIKMTQDESGCCSQTFHPIAKEFQKEKFGLSHQPVEDFLKSQWQTSERSYLWLLYRWGLAICFSVGVVGSLVQLWYEGLWFIYLTDWGFLLCMCISIFGAILVTLKHFKPHKLCNDSIIFKFYWACHWSTLVVATVITFMYWLFVYPRDNVSASELGRFRKRITAEHLMCITFENATLQESHVLKVINTAYDAQTSRKMRSSIMADAMNEHGNRYIYEVLDWSQPGWAVLMVLGCLVIVFIFSFLLFCLYKLRSAICRKCMNSKMTLNA